MLRVIRRPVRGAGRCVEVLLVVTAPHQQDDRTRVLDASDIVEVVGDHIALKPKGREFVGLCPFHDDHRPSMNVVPHKQFYHCFSCGAGGDVFDFVMRFHGMSFREALEFLASRAGVELTPWRPGPGSQAPAEPGVTRETLRAANRAAQDFFRSILAHAEHGRAAREVIAARGISPAMAELFGLGAAPDRWDGLLTTVRHLGMDEAPFAEADLLKTRQDGSGRYDAMRNRLVFPILDRLGEPIAFGGRRLSDDGDEVKYINSAETRLFKKHATLYGLHAALRPIQNARSAVVVEGYTDVIACHQAGITSAVGTLGTAVTAEHARVLRQLCDTVVLVFDGDEAGMRAAERGLDVFFMEPVDVRVAVLPAGQDPDDLARTMEGAAALRTAVEDATDALTFRFDRLGAKLRERGHEPGSNARARAIEEEVARLAELGMAQLPPIRQQTIVRRIASLAGVEESTVVAAIPRGRRARSAEGRAAALVEGMPAVPVTAGEHAVAYLLAEPSLAVRFPDAARDILDGDAYGSPHVRAVVERMARVLESGDAPGHAAVLGGLDEEACRRVVAAFLAYVERTSEGDAGRVTASWHDAVRRFRLEHAADGGEGSPGGAGGPELASLEATIRRKARYGGRQRLPRPRG